MSRFIRLLLKTGRSSWTPVEEVSTSAYIDAHLAQEDLESFLDLNDTATLSVLHGGTEWYTSPEELGTTAIESWLAAFLWLAMSGSPVDVWAGDKPAVTIHTTRSTLRLSHLHRFRLNPRSRLVVPLDRFLSQLLATGTALANLAASVRSALGADAPVTLEPELWTRCLYDNASLSVEEQDRITDLQLLRFAEATKWPRPNGPALVPAAAPPPVIPLPVEDRRRLVLAALPADLEGFLGAVRSRYPAAASLATGELR